MSRKINTLKFKDKCDGCEKFAILKGYCGKCFCEKCIKNYISASNRKKQLSIYDLLSIEK